MRVFVDLETNGLIIRPGYGQELTKLNFKRSPQAGLEVQFTRSGTVVELAPDGTGIWGIKKDGEYDADYATAALAWVKTGTGEETVYSFIFPLITPELDALFHVDADPDNDLPEITLMGELEWTVGGVTYKTPTLEIIVENDVNRGGETLPAMPPIAYGVFLPSITGLVGGTPTDLDGIPTVKLLTGAIVLLMIDVFGERQWLPFELAVVAAGPGVVEPLDFDAVDNNRRWRGAVGPAGLSIVFIGPYDELLGYVSGNMVSFEGESFVALGPTTGNAPTPGEDNAWWALVAKKGADGADSTVPGPPGADGADSARSLGLLALTEWMAHRERMERTARPARMERPASMERLASMVRRGGTERARRQMALALTEITISKVRRATFTKRRAGRIRLSLTSTAFLDRLGIRITERSTMKMSLARKAITFLISTPGMFTTGKQLGVCIGF